jgi:hypothetical protein
MIRSDSLGKTTCKSQSFIIALIEEKSDKMTLLLGTSEPPIKAFSPSSFGKQWWQRTMIPIELIPKVSQIILRFPPDAANHVELSPP